MIYTFLTIDDLFLDEKIEYFTDPSISYLAVAR